MSKSRRRQDQTKDKHPLDETLRFQHRWIREFSVAHSDIWEVIGSSITMVEMTQLAVSHQPNLSMIEVHRSVMWQTVLDYQIQSIILILQHRLDSGFALLRMAAELSRDVYVIGNYQTRIDLWMEKEKKRREYQAIFKFDKSLPQAEKVYDVYKFCSAFGVHGHISNNIFSEMIGRAGKDGQFALFDVSENGILQGVGTWLAGFAPIHHLCAREFFVSRPIDLVKAFSLWREFELKSLDLVQSYQAALEERMQTQDWVLSKDG